MKAKKLILQSRFIVIAMLLGILLFGSSPVLVKAAELNTNLILNPGGELGTSENGCINLSNNNWPALSGNAWYAYGAQTKENPISTHSGNYFITICSGTSNSMSGSCYQDIDVSSKASEIDKGVIMMDFSAYIQKTGTVEGSEAKIQVQQLDENGSPTCDVFEVACSNHDVWEQFNIYEVARPGTKKIRITLIGINITGLYDYLKDPNYMLYNYAAFDDLSLKLISDTTKAPTITQIQDQDNVSSEVLGPIPFTVADEDTPVNNLEVTAVSSNQAVISDSNIKINVNNENSTITLTSTPNQVGKSDITITVSDGTKYTKMTFSVVVYPKVNVKLGENLIVNGDGSSLTGWKGETAEFLSTKYPQNEEERVFRVRKDGANMYQDFNVSKFTPLIDAGWLEFSSSYKIISGFSSPRVYVQGFDENGNKLWEKSKGTIEKGTKIVRVGVTGSYGDRIDNINFIISNAGYPKIKYIPDQIVKVGSSISGIPFTVGYATDSIHLTASSSNNAIISESGITFFGGEGYQRYMSISPQPNVSGTADISIKVDGNTITTFKVTVFMDGGNCGANANNMTWSISGKEGDYNLNIIGSGVMMDYDKQNLPPWDSYKNSTKTLVLDKELNHIGNEAFKGYSGVNKVIIPSSVTSIGEGAFIEWSEGSTIYNLSNVDMTNANYSGAALGRVYSIKTIVDGITTSVTKFIGDEQDTFVLKSPEKTRCFFEGWNTKQDGTGTKYMAGAYPFTELVDMTLYAQWSEGTRYEAEAATIVGAAKEENKDGASGRSQVGNINEIGRYVEFSNIPAYSKVSVRYASNVSGKISVYVNNDKIKDLNFTSTGDWSGVGKYKNLIFDVNIPKDGTLKIQFDEGDGALNLDYIECCKSSSFKKYEAENANIVGANKESNIDGASGGSQIGSINEAGRYVEFKDLPAGNKVLLRYATKETGTISIYKNNVHYQDLSFESTGNWSGNNMYRIASIDIDLKANDILKVQLDDGDIALNLDYIEICSPLYDVNFNSNGGTEVLSQKVIANNKAQKPEAPTKADLTFENWYSDATLTTVFDFSTAITENKTLYAKWINNAGRITVNTEDVNKGTVNVTNAESLGENVYNATTGSAITLTAVPKEGYNFDGWYDASDNKVSINSTWRFKVTADATYTAKFVSMPTATLTVNIVGNGSVSSNDEAWNNDNGITLLLGTNITLTAVDTEANPFMYWKDNNGRVLSANKQYSVNIGNNISLTAVFGTKAEDNICVTFRNGNAEIIQSSYVTKGKEIIFPASPYMYGYTFDGWDKTAEEIKAATKDIVVNALFKKSEIKFNINVIGGTGTGEYSVKDYVTIEANTPQAGEKFSYWEDSNNNIVCYDTTYKFYATTDATLTAVYVEDDVVVEQKASIVITSITKDASSKKLFFIAERIVPDNYTIISHGIIITNDGVTGASETDFIIDGTGVLKGTAKTKGLAGTYSLYKGNVNVGEEWFARGYVIYKDSNGNVITIYSSVVSEIMN